MSEPIDLLVDGPARAKRTVVLAHGAGAPMDAPFMERMAQGLGSRGLRVVRFEFAYMARRRSEGRRPGPDRPPVLLERWRSVIRQVGRPERMLIGGKSMGGRIATMVADECAVLGLACLGYPFHPPGRADKLRTAHLAELRTPTLIVQGTRDPFGTRDEVAGYELSPAIRFAFLEDGDHSFKPRKASGRTLDQNLDQAIDAVARFADSL